MATIKELIDPAFKEKTIWVKYLDDFEIEIRYLHRSQIQKITERAKETTWDKKTHLPVEKLDRDKLYKDFISQVIVNWRGLTGETLSKMLPVKVDDPKMIISFSEENAFEILKDAYDFETFINQMVMDIEKFQTGNKEEEIKN